VRQIEILRNDFTESWKFL